MLRRYARLLALIQLSPNPKAGVKPLSAAYRSIIDRHDIDLVLLIDGGTDSIIFGDEPGVGTVLEDAVSTVASCDAAGDRAILAAIGFGIDHHHGVSHHAFLENVARLIRDAAFLGVLSLTPGTAEAEAFLSLVDHANLRQPQHRSIVCNSIAGALRGEFGDYHATDRTSGSEQFINPLMLQYWAFEAPRIVQRMIYAGALRETERFEDARAVIEDARNSQVLRPRRSLPL